jgi:hypothetical protein
VYASTEMYITDSYRNSAVNIQVTGGFARTCPTSGYSIRVFYSTPSGGVHCSWKLNVAAVSGTQL